MSGYSVRTRRIFERQDAHSKPKRVWWRLFAVAILLTQVVGCSTPLETTAQHAQEPPTAVVHTSTSRFRLPEVVWRRLPNCAASSDPTYSLTDAATKVPLVVLSDGQPEVFMMVYGCEGDVNVRFVGFFSGHRVAIAHAVGERPFEVPVVRRGGTYKLRGTSRTVAVGPSCCKAETPVYERGTAKTPIFERLTERLQLFTREERVLSHQDCLPFRYPLFVLNAEQSGPAWVKLYGVKHIPPLEGIRCSEEGTALVEDRVDLGSHLGDGSALAFIESPSGQVVFRIDLSTGLPIGPIPTEVRIYDFEEVRDFRDEFRRRFECRPGVPCGFRGTYDGPPLKAVYERALMDQFFR
jgi:hypothetical protein